MKTPTFPTSKDGSEVFISRQSEATFWDADGVLKTAGPNELRMSHDPQNLAAPPFPLKEPKSANLNPFSSYVSSHWSGESMKPGVGYQRTGPKTYFDKDGILQTAADNEWPLEHDPVTHEPIGRSVWEARTNHIRNSTMQGAVAGSPGTVPTNWQNAPAQNGLTREIVGVGTEDGIDYIDIRWSGVTSVAGSIVFAMPENTTVVPAAQGQTWTGSLYARLVGGSLDNVNQLRLLTGGRTGAGVFIESGEQNMLGITEAPLKHQRFSATRTMANADIAYVTLQVSMSHASGVAIDITLRIGLPQLEQGATASPPIPTSGSAVTRSADVVSITGANFSRWFNPDEGTFVIEGSSTRTDSNITFVQARNESNSGEVRILRGMTSTYASLLYVRDDSIGQALNVAQTGTPIDGTTYKIAAAYKRNDLAISRDGAAPTTHTAAEVPGGLDRLFIGSNSGSAQFINGHIRRIVHYPQRLSNADLQILSAGGEIDAIPVLDIDFTKPDAAQAGKSALVTANYNSAPNGKFETALMSAPGGGSVMLSSPLVNFEAGKRYVASCFVRLNSALNKSVGLRLPFTAFGKFVQVSLNLATGAIEGAGQPEGFGYEPIPTHNMVRLWISHTATQSVQTTGAMLWMLDEFASGEGVEFWCMQVEEGSKPTSPILTYGGVKVREADFFGPSLPGVSMRDYSYKPGVNTIRTEMEAGPARVRRRFLSVPREVRVVWRLTAEQLDVFETFYHDALFDGAAWFNMPVVDGKGESVKLCRFKQPYEVTTIAKEYMWQVQAVLEVAL